MAVAVIAAGCAATYQESTEADLTAAAEGLEPLPADDDARPPTSFDGSLETYQALAMRRSPALRATFERWRAAVHRIPQARRLPEPRLTYGYFIQSVETRVGPQRHRLGVRWAFPWPSKLTRGADAASASALAAQRRFETQALSLRQQVAEVYWEIWHIERQRGIQADQLEVLQALSQSTRVRVEVSAANLADLNQVDLRTARAADRLDGFDEAETMASARLLALVGAPSGADTPVTPAMLPVAALPAAPRGELVMDVRAHPQLNAPRLMSEAAEQRSRRARADRAPDFSVGLDWIETGEAVDPNMAGSGTDPVIAMVGLSIPLVYAEQAAERQALAEAEAFRADALDARYQAEAELDRALASIRDAARRIELYENTLIPQAEVTYASVVGAYQTGRSTIAAALLIQRDLIELQVGLAHARRDHAVAWARLEFLVGHDVEAGGAP